MNDFTFPRGQSMVLAQVERTRLSPERRNCTTLTVHRAMRKTVGTVTPETDCWEMGLCCGRNRGQPMRRRDAVATSDGRLAPSSKHWKIGQT